MYSPKSPAIAAFTIVFLLLTLVQSIDAQAGPAVERNAEARFPPTPQSKNFARLDDLLERKRKRSMNGQEETFLGSIDPAPPCDESMKAPLKARAVTSTASLLSTLTTSSTSAAAAAPTKQSEQCVCTESGCSPESPPCCADGSCNLRAESTGAEGLRLRLSFGITVFALAFSFFLC